MTGARTDLSQASTGVVVLATRDTGFSGPTELGGQCAPLVEIAGQTLAERVVRAARTARTVKRVVLVTAEAEEGCSCPRPRSFFPTFLSAFLESLAMRFLFVPLKLYLHESIDEWVVAHVGYLRHDPLK